MSFTRRTTTTLPTRKTTVKPKLTVTSESLNPTTTYTPRSIPSELNTSPWERDMIVVVTLIVVVVFLLLILALLLWRRIGNKVERPQLKEPQGMPTKTYILPSFSVQEISPRKEMRRRVSAIPNVSSSSLPKILELREEPSKKWHLPSFSILVITLSSNMK
jgi:hypothetical protein